MNNIIKASVRSLDRVRRSKFARNVAVVASGTVGAQAISMAFAPLITRLYGPDAFGLLGTFLAIVSLATPVAALAYPIAIVLPRDDRDAVGLVRLSAYLSLLIAILCAVALWLGGDWLIVALRLDSIGVYILLIPIFMLFSAWIQISHQWLIRKEEFDVLAKVTVISSLVVNSAKSGIGLFHPFTVVLIALAYFGQALNFVLLTIGACRRYQRTEPITAPSPQTRLRTLAYRYRDFPMYRAPQTFINAVSQSLPILMLAAFFGPAAAGFYALGKMVMGMPTSLVGKAIGDVFYPKIAEVAHTGGNLTRLISKSTSALFLIGLAPFGIIIVFGPSLFTFVFGSEWTAAGEYAQWLAAWYFFGFANRPSVASVPVLSLQGEFLIYEIASVLLRSTALAAGYFIFSDDLVAVALFSITGLVLNFSLIVYTLRASTQRLSRA